MDHATKSFLIQNNCSQFIEAFQDGEITMETLYSLQRNDILSSTSLQLFGCSLPFGRRVEFANCLSKKVQDDVIKQSPMYIVHRSLSADTVIIDEDFDSLDNNSSASSSNENSPFVKPSSTLPLKKKRRFSINLEVSKVLGNASMEAKGIAQKYEKMKSRNMFDEHERSVIVDVLVEHVNNNFAAELAQSSLAVFEKVAECIIEEYPCEIKAMYFRQPVSNHKGIQVARATGKLMEKYYNVGRKLRCLGLSPSQQRKSIALQRLKTSYARDLLPLDDDEEETYLDNKAFLHYNTSPWSSIEEKWRATSRRRLREVYNLDNKMLEGDHLDVDTLVKEWPLIANPLGYLLLQIDFIHLYKLEFSPFFQRWNEFKPQLKSLYRDEIKDRLLRRELNPFVNKEFTDGEDSMLLWALPCLFEPKNIKCASAKMKTWRPSRVESMEGFISTVKTTEEVKPKIEYRRARMSSYGITLQPFVIACSKGSVSESTECYVVIDSFTYSVDSPLIAVDFCMKAIHSLGAKYDKESERCWTFLQLFFYDIKTPYDSVIDSKIVYLIKKLTTSLENNDCL